MTEVSNIEDRVGANWESFSPKISHYGKIQKKPSSCSLLQLLSTDVATGMYDYQRVTPALGGAHANWVQQP